jgi:Zn-dependent protease
MTANLSIGKLFGTQVVVHWTFFILIAWVILSESFSGKPWGYIVFDRILFNLEFVIAVMICVLLHEFGHVLAAKRYGIKTERIVLLPIGGISVQNKPTDSPKEEFFITIAGPLVNIIIAVLLYFIIPVREFMSYNLGEYFNALNDFSVQTFLFFLFIVNITLVLFNMIPAFPLDGGRLLRALLDLQMHRVRATSVTATIGHIIAIILLLIGLLFNPILIFMSLFLFIGNYGENKIVHQLELLKGHIVKDAMLEDISVFHPDDTIEDVIKVILSGYETNFIVIKNQKIVGLLYHKDIIQNSNNKTYMIKELMTTKFKTLNANERLTAAYGLMQDEIHPFFPVLENDKLVGAIDFGNLHEFLLMEAKLQH